MTCRHAALLSLTLLVAAPSRAQQPEPAAPAVPAAQPAVQVQRPAEAVPVVAGTATATEAPPARGRWGLGASIASSGEVPTLYLPVDLEGSRLEPELAFAQATIGGARSTAAHLGFGLFRLVPTAPGVQAYWGGRLQYQWANLAGTTFHGARIAAAVGGEWLPVPAVALGVEGQLGYSAMSASLPAGSGGVAARGVATSALVFLRVFPGRASPDRERAAPAQGTPRTPPRGTRCKQTADCSGIDMCHDGVCRH